MNIDDIVYGHAKAKKALKTILAKNEVYYFKKYIEAESDCPNPARVHLLRGNSGCGKTYLVKQLCELTDTFLYYVDGTSINIRSIRSYDVGSLRRDILRQMKVQLEEYKLLTGTAGSIEGQLSQLVVFIDEFDKICKPIKDDNDGWQTRVQSELLTLFEGDELFKEVTFILAGAFTTLKKPVQKNALGFSSETETLEYDIYSAFHEYGCITEILGRIGHFIELDEFDEEDYLKIIEKYVLPDKNKEHMFFSGKTLEPSEKELAEIAKRAVKNGQGVRYCKRAISDLMLEEEEENDILERGLPDCL
jgi:ATP-dependent protease Clp ATPase subunit